MSVVSKLRFDQSGIDGIKIFLSDFGWMETYREQELIKRFQAVMKTAGVVAENYTDDILLPTSGAVDGYCYISPGTAVTESGGLIELNGTFSFDLNVGVEDPTGKWIVAEFSTMYIDVRQHRETGVNYYMREVPTSGAADVFYLTTTSPDDNTDENIIYLGKVIDVVGNKPVFDTTEDNRQLFSVFSGAAHAFILWLYELLKDNQSDFEDFVNTRYAQLVTLLASKTFPDGTIAQTTSNTPNVPKNIRIRDVSPIRYSPEVATIDPTEATVKLSLPAKQGFQQGRARVEIWWGWNDVVGSGDASQFVITSSKNSDEDEYQFALNELAGYWLWFNNTNYQIISNTAISGGATVCQVRDANGATVNLTGLSSTVFNPAIIHSNADKYVVTTSPVIPPGPPLPPYRREYQVTYADSPVAQKFVVDLDLKTYYVVNVQAHIGNNKSAWGLMDAGQYTKFSTAQTYTQYFLCKLPDIPTSSPALGLESTTQGFRIAITGYDTSGTGMPDAFELVWTYDTGAADFDNPNHEHRMLYGSRTDVITPISAEYKVKARPIQAGQVVGSEISNTIVSGAGGRLPNEKVLPAIYFNLQSHYIQMAIQSTGALEYVLVASSGDPEWAVSQWIGKRLADASANMYEITKNDSNTLAIRKISDDYGDLEDINLTEPVHVGDSGPVTGVGGGSFTPYLLRQRKVTEHDFPNDVFITRAQVDCEFTDGTPANPAILRIYQSGRAAYAKTIEVNASETFFSEVIELSILNSYGNRRLIADFWDPSGNGNTLRVKGVLTIFYRDHVEMFTASATIVS